MRTGQKAEAEKIAADAAKSRTLHRDIEKGIDRRFSFMLWIKDNPLYAPMRNDPRFRAQVRRLNLPE